MNLGLFLAIGESLTDLKNKGQLDRLIKYNVKKYSQNFDKVYIFSYSNEKFKLPKNCQIIPNDLGLHRYLYAILLPFIKRHYINQCDILRGLQLSGGIPALIAKIFFGKKFVINYGYDYASFAKIEGKPIQSVLYKLIRNPIVKLANATIVTSKEIKKVLGNTGSKIVYIPNGVDINLFRAKNSGFQAGLKANLGARKRKPRLLGHGNLFRPQKVTKPEQTLRLIYMGRLEKQKNLDNLIRAIAIINSRPKGNTKNKQLRDIGIRVKLVIYGKGSLKNHLLRLAKKQKVYLEINPPKDYRNVPKTLKSAEVFILPSLEEGNPKILIEAMATGKAVIGSNVLGIKELIIDGVTGIITQTDPGSIASSIERLEDQKIREKLGRTASLYIKKNFDIDKLLSQEVNLLKNIAKS